MRTAAELKGKRVQMRVVLDHYRFPRKKTDLTPGHYAIVIFVMNAVLQGEVPEEFMERDGTYKITATGYTMPVLQENANYILTGTLVNDKKWGYQYEVEEIHMDYDLSKEEDQRTFFSFFLSEDRINSLFEVLGDPLKALQRKDIKELQRVKGIGPVIALKMCQKFEECKGNSRAYVALKNYGLTKNAIDNLVRHYHSADVAVEKIEQNPYILIKEVKGYGWERADNIALRKGFTSGCKERVLAYAQYYLDTQADVNGNSWVSIDDLLDNIANNCVPATKADIAAWIKEDMAGKTDFDEYVKNPADLDSFRDKPTFYYEKDQRRVGLLHLRLLERHIADHFKRLQTAESTLKYDREVCERIIADTEKEVGYSYTDEQRKAMWDILDKNVTLLVGSAGCVDCDTEFFNGTRWKKISEYESGEKVLMYKEDGAAELVEPSAYVRYPASQLWLTQTKYGIDMCLSEEHNVYYVSSRGHICHKPFAQVKNIHETSKSGFGGRFITAFNFGQKGIDLTDAEIKLMLAVICDGSFSKGSSTTRCRFHIKKDRKKAEIRRVFTEAGIKWREYESANSGYTDFYAYVPRREKTFSDYWYGCSHEQLQLICDNILAWDGSVAAGRKRFSTTSKENADFVQYAFASCGRKAVITTHDRCGQSKIVGGKTYEYKTIEYSVSITDRVLVGIGGFHKGDDTKTRIVPYATRDGFKYCFTVPTHMWAMRRNGKILITGNTGKSHTLKPLIKIFTHYNMKVEQTALSGRASSLLSEITDVDGKTIHRLLSYMPEYERFAHTERCPLKADVIILDESSMVGEELFLCLIRAIKTGAKLIMLGDVKQLPPMSVGNILSDCIRSSYIATNTLTKIHRQAMQSGIIVQSLMAAEGRSLVKNDFVGEEVRGILQDFKIISAQDQALIQYNIVKEFKRLYLTMHVPAKDIQVIVPTRVRGGTSCRALNELIQNIVNPGNANKSTQVQFTDNGMKYAVTFKVGDRVIVNRNNYHAMDASGNEQAIYNGNIGFIKDMGDDAMVIHFDEQGDIILSKEDWWNINLAYAITIHKLQGSQSPYIIIGIDYTAYALLSRELVYTALTRAQKFCTLVAQPKAINTAVKTSAIKLKQTWLKDDLLNLLIEQETGGR